MAESRTRAENPDEPLKGAALSATPSAYRDQHVAHPQKPRRPDGGRRRSGTGTGPGRGRRAKGGRAERQMVPDAEPRSYYGQPVIKAPVWTWEVPVYFFFGGMAGAAGALSGAARLAGHEAVAKRAAVVAVIGSGVSPVLLISDLGRPTRFLNMLRVFKVTSPMSVGTWILSAFGATSGVAMGWQLLGLPPKLLGVPAQLATSLLGPPLAVYTAVLTSTTAVPVWSESRRILPFVFAGSSMASAGGFTALLTPKEDAAPARAMAIVGALTEVAAVTAMERNLDPRLRESYEGPTVKRLERGARYCALGGAALMAVAGRRSRTAAVVAGAALMAGSLLEREAVIKAGGVSARDPKQTVGPQRERADAAASRGGTGDGFP